MSNKKKVPLPEYYHMRFWNEEAKLFMMGESKFKDFKDMVLAALGWLPLGDTEKALRSLTKTLRWVKDAQDFSGNKKEFVAHAKTKKEVFGNWDYMIFQVLHEKGLLEGIHALPGVVSETGKEMLKALESYFEKLDKENAKKVK